MTIPADTAPSSPAPRHLAAVAIVGAGFSGTMAAIHLRRLLPPDHVIYLFDRTGRFARGPAYSDSDTPHLLNVRSANMSALPDDPGHFDRWLAENAERWPEGALADRAGPFASRQRYGRYLRALLYAEMRSSGGRVRLCADGVARLQPMPGGVRLHCASGQAVEAAAVVLAVGNLPSAQPCDGVTFHDPWSDGATAGLRPGEPVLIVGTGLTMVDLALGIAARRVRAPVVALSRRGLAPQRHGPALPPVPASPFTPAERRSVLALLRAVRARLRAAAAEGADWRQVIDGLRPVTAALWQGLPKAERARFLRHVRPYWDIHRHRLAPAAADAFDELRDSGSLRLLRGRVKAVQRVPGPAAEVTVQARDGAAERLLVQRVIFATGAGAGAGHDGFVTSLIAGGLAETDPHCAGLAVTETLRVTGRDGAAGIWALGPVVKGVFWECTAVPDIRVQARQVAEEVCRHLAAGPA